MSNSSAGALPELAQRRPARDQRHVAPAQLRRGLMVGADEQRLDERRDWSRAPTTSPSSDRRRRAASSPASASDRKLQSGRSSSGSISTGPMWVMPGQRRQHPFDGRADGRRSDRSRLRPPFDSRRGRPAGTAPAGHARSSTPGHSRIVRSGLGESPLRRNSLDRVAIGPAVCHPAPARAARRPLGPGSDSSPSASRIGVGERVVAAAASIDRLA